MRELAANIRYHLANERERRGITFEEENHKYTIYDRHGNIISPISVSTKVKQYHEEFDSQGISYSKASGDPEKQARLLWEWKEAGRIGAGIGSRCHYYLEQNLITYYGLDKTVRQPIFDIDGKDIAISDRKISAGNKYIELMIQRGCVLVDTEMVLGCESLMGQLDKCFLVKLKNGKIGIFITDWKATKYASFLQQRWSKSMRAPFGNYIDTAYSKYSVQLGLYSRLLMEMLGGCFDVEFCGAIIVILQEDETFIELKVQQDFFNIVNGILL